MMAKVIQEGPVDFGAVRQGPRGGLCLLSTEAAWVGFENSLTCVTCPSFWPVRGQTVPTQKGERFPAGPHGASVVLPARSCRAASVNVAETERKVS